MIDIKHVRVSGASGPFIHLIIENTMASPVTLELDCCATELQDVADMVPTTIRKLRTCLSMSLESVFSLGPLTVEDLEIRGPNSCLYIGPCNN